MGRERKLLKSGRVGRRYKMRRERKLLESD